MGSNSKSVSNVNNTNISSESNLSGLNPNKYEISQNESILNMALTDMKKYIQSNKIRQFKFNFIKKELGIDENDKMSGTSYEEFARKSFKIMLMMITQNNINFENPKNVKIKDLIQFYLSNAKNNINKNLKIQTNIHNIILTSLIDYHMEIDIVTEFENSVIYKLIEMFPKNVFFYDEIEEYLKNEKKKDNNVSEYGNKITLVAEIARNIIVQANEKLKQTIKYVEFLSILNLYKDNIAENINSEVLNSIYKSCKMSESTEKIFCLITDGDYVILKFVFNNILKEIFKNKIESNTIKEFINKKVKANNIFMRRVEEKGIKLIEEKIYDNYTMFDNLNKNKIKFFVLYVGDIHQNFYQQNLLCNIFVNEKLNKNQDILNIFNSLKYKNNLDEIKSKNRSLKKLITSFNEKIDLITKNKFEEMKLESVIDKILEKAIKNNHGFNYNNLEKKIKIDLEFILCTENNQSLNDKYKNLEQKYNFINSVKASVIENEVGISYIDDLINFTEPKTFKIYVLDNNEIYKRSISKKIIKKEDESYNVRYIFYEKKNGNYEIDLGRSNFQKIFDKAFININQFIIEEINNIKKKINYSNKNRNEILTKEKLIIKLKDEFTELKINGSPLFEIINKYAYKPNNEQYKNLIYYFQEAFNLIKKNNFNANDLSEKITQLIENIICKRIYAFISYKIMLYINEKVYQNLKEKLLKLMDSIK